MSSRKSSTSSLKLVKFSAAEQAVIGVLRKSRGPIDTLRIVERVYGEDVPFNARQIIGGLLRSIQRKAEHNKEPWRVVSTGRKGPHSIFWSIV